jgi:hypothetical protein
LTQEERRIAHDQKNRILHLTPFAGRCVAGRSILHRYAIPCSYGNTVVNGQSATHRQTDNPNRKEEHEVVSPGPKRCGH